MNNLSQREKILLIILAVLVVGTAYYFYLYQPLEMEMKKLEREIQSKQKELAQTLSLIKNLPEAKERYESLKNEKMLIENKELNTEKILKYCEEFARQAGLEIVSFTPQENKAGISYELKLIGDFFQLNSFLTKLRLLEGSLLFQELSIEPYQEQLQAAMLLLKNSDGGVNDD